MISNACFKTDRPIQCPPPPAPPSGQGGGDDDDDDDDEHSRRQGSVQVRVFPQSLLTDQQDTLFSVCMCDAVFLTPAGQEGPHGRAVA